MSKINYISIVLNRFFIVLLVLLLVDSFTVIEIKSQIIKSIVYFGLILLCPIVLLFKLWFYKKHKVKTISLLLPIVVLIGIFYIGPTKIIFSSRVWKTKKILFINKENHKNRVEYQTQDMGALGYNKRMVEVTHITNWFMMIKNSNKKNFQNEK
uniref:hypothetical protein n=1 Tax=Gelidibacter sp. TaxID=2018083 RepID=UPI00404B0866